MIWPKNLRSIENILDAYFTETVSVKGSLYGIDVRINATIVILTTVPIPFVHNRVQNTA